MSWARITAIFLRIVQQFRRDRRTLALMFTVPVAVTLLVGYVVRSSEASLSVAVVDETASPTVQLLAGRRTADGARSGGLGEGRGDAAGRGAETTGRRRCAGHRLSKLRRPGGDRAAQAGRGAGAGGHQPPGQRRHRPRRPAGPASGGGDGLGRFAGPA